jgi:hypothetical protein
MEPVTYSCGTDGCQRQGQATQARWCEACGLPNSAGSSAAAPQPGQPSSPFDPLGAATPLASRPLSLDGHGSGAVAIAVVVALTALVLFATHSMLGIGGGGNSSASASVTATYPYQVEQEAPETAPETFATEDPSTTDTTVPEPASELTGSASASASATALDSKDDAGDQVSYEVERVLDGDPSTAWRAKGDGQGVTVTLTLAGPSHITQVGLIPGYDKTDSATGKNRFFQDHRISEVRWRFDDGTTVDQSLSDEPTMQMQEVDVTSTTVTIEIAATLPSEPGFDYTPISDVSVMGTQ